MIEGFEPYTCDLTDKELEAMRIIAKTLSKKLGVENAVTNKKIVEGMKTLGFTLPQARVRKIINFIRLRKIVVSLVASKKGYYVEPNKAKLSEYVKSLRQRADSIHAVADSLEI